MKELTYQVNDVLKALFDAGNMILVDFKLEFGVFHDRIVLGDEFSPDGCRLWDKDTKKNLIKTVSAKVWVVWLKHMKKLLHV